jgi:hypothetical protein
MSYKDLSAGTGPGSGPSPDKPKGRVGEELSKEDLKTSAPWEALRPVEPKPDEPKPPSRLGNFFRKALRWVTGLIVVFGLGVGTTWFLRVRPMNYQIEDLKNQLEAANITVSQLEEQISASAALINENENLKNDLQETQLHVDIMRILVDVSSAELALASEDVVTTKASLAGTDERLANLEETLQGEDQQTIEGMRTRLTLVLEELETDTFAALSDLDVLKSNLLALERSLFGN